MKIEHRKNKERGVFLAIKGEEAVGEMTYQWTTPTCFAIDHTEVTPKFTSQGIGNQLVKSAVDYAREKKFTIIPLCAFARAEFARHPEYEEVRN